MWVCTNEGIVISFFSQLGAKVGSLFCCSFKIFEELDNLVYQHTCTCLANRVHPLNRSEEVVGIG